MEHHFNCEIARRFGVNAAIIFNNISFWVSKNWSEGRHYHDGRHWTYMSKKGMAKIFSYLSVKQIDLALKKLESGGLILSGNYNTASLDHTKWYALSDDGLRLLQKGVIGDEREQSDTTKGGNDYYQREQSIIYNNNIYNNTNNYTNNKPDNKDIHSVLKTIDDKDLKKELSQFVTMRKKLRKEITPYGLELAIKKLYKMTESQSERIAIVRQSIERSWLGFYPLDNGAKQDESALFDKDPSSLSEIERAFMSSYEGSDSSG